MRKAQGLSLRLYFVIAVIFGLSTLAIATGLSVWGIGAARDSVERAKHSYEQLALVSRMEANIGRLLVSEMRRIVEPLAHREKDTVATEKEVEGALNQLVLQIQEEIKSLKDADERAAEQGEFQNAHTLRALYRSMMNGIDRERRLIRGLDTGSALRAFIRDVIAFDYAHLNRIVRTVSVDERKEVSEAIQGLEDLNGMLVMFALVGMLMAASLAVFGGLTTYRTVTTPLDRLTRGAQALADGSLQHRIAERGPRELMTLAQNFNNMADRVQSHRDELTRLNERLEDAIADRTRELEEKARQLSEIDRTRRLFFAKVSHELRTPLTVLLADAQLALQSQKDEPQPLRNALQHIFAQGEFLKRRISDLIHLARSEDGKVVLEQSKFALDDVLRETVKDANAYAKSSFVTLNCQLPSEPVLITGDRSWIRQGILSILDNAIKFSPPNGDVRVVLQNQENRITVSIEDEGLGTPKDDLPKLFDPYYQSEDGRSRGGTGLGLAVGRWVAEHHGGRIFAQNVASGGLRVSMEFPLST